MQTNCILDKLPLGIMVFNEELDITYINKPGDLFLKQDLRQEYLMKVIKRFVLMTLQKHLELEKIIKIYSGKGLHTWRAKTEIIKTFPYQVMVILQDETGTSQLEETILKAEKLAIMGQMAVGVLVEIRNPLTIAKGFCQLIKIEEQINKEYINLMSEELDKIAKLAGNFSVDTSLDDFSTYRDISREIERWFRYKHRACGLICVLDTFDNLLINVRKKPMSTIITNLLNYFVSLVEKNQHIIIHTESYENLRYLDFHFKSSTKSGWTNIGLDSKKLRPIIKLIENNNGKFDVKLVNNTTIDARLQLPATKACS